MERMYGAGEAAKMLGVSIQEVDRRCLSGDIPAQKVSRRWIIPIKSILTYRRNRRPRGRPKNNSKG